MYQLATDMGFDLSNATPQMPELHVHTYESTIRAIDKFHKLSAEQL